MSQEILIYFFSSSHMWSFSNIAFIHLINLWLMSHVNPHGSDSLFVRSTTELRLGITRMSVDANPHHKEYHYSDVIMGAIGYQITSVSIDCPTVCSQKTSNLRVTGLVRGNHRGSVDSHHKGPVSRENVSIWWRHHGNKIMLITYWYIRWLLLNGRGLYAI